MGKLLEANIIREESRPCCSQRVQVPKKNYGSLKLCHNFKPLNKITVPDNWPKPSSDECLDSLAGKHFYSVFDWFSGYFVVPVLESNIFKTAFITPYGTFGYECMSFGLHIVIDTYVRLTSTILKQFLNAMIKTGLLWKKWKLLDLDLITLKALFS